MSPPILEDRRPLTGRVVGFTLLFAAVAWGLGVFAALPWQASPPGAALLKVAFKHVAAVEAEGEELSPEELAKLPRHMRPQRGERARTGKRRDAILRIALDGRRVLEKTYRPGGLRHDGPTFAYEELPLAVGRRRLAATLWEGRADAGEREEPEAVRWRLEREVEVRPGQVFLVDFSEETGFVLR